MGIKQNEAQPKLDVPCFYIRYSLRIIILMRLLLSLNNSSFICYLRIYYVNFYLFIHILNLLYILFRREHISI